MAKGIWSRLVCLAALLVCAVGLSIRLVSPLNNGVGRLEVYYNGSWGTVCDDDFGQLDAIVACRQLGRYDTGMTPKWISSFGFGSGKIWLDNLNCNGTESSLKRCSHNGWGTHNCGHHEDVGILCDENEVTVKLTPGHTKGLLQVYHSGRWGTVCDDGFGQVEASVVCRALGYQAGKVIDTNSSIPMWLDDVQCTMLNTDLKDCKHRQWGEDNCDPSEAVGVECFSFAEESTATRLVSTTNTPGEGVLELYYDGQWGRVCSTGFGVEEATVACRMLGHNTIGASYIAYTKTSTPPVILDKVQCLGTELSFNECLHYPWVNVNCSSSTVAGIRCPSAYSQIRLNSTIRGRGRVEVLHNNVWGTVCRGSSFSSQEAQVVCKMANLPWTSAYVTTSYGPGEGLVWMSNVNCAGTETSLDECSHTRWGTVTGCSHSSDVGVVCLGATLQIHLEPTGSVLNVPLGQVISVVCVVDYSNSPVTSFRWTHNGRSYNGQTLSKTVTSKSDSGSLECSAGNVLASTQINVLYPPVVHLEPGNDTLDASVGEDLRVDCVVDDANPSVHTFRWSHNGQTSTGSTFLKRNITHSDQGKLTCTADNGHMMTPGRAVAHVNVRLQVPPLIGSEDTMSKNQLIAIVTGSVGIVTIIILIAVIIHLKRSLHAAKLEDKPNERSDRTEQARRADEISASNQQIYETMELSSGGAENTYCHFQMTPVRDDDPDQTYDNPGFAEEENLKETSGKEREMRKAEGQAYDDEPVYQNTSGSNQVAM
ncbi:deleted in malignant brain tumors 1 protein-like [Haliotis rufescens]|uniref:deleted in malignant brain tumors 1 protein-like n=1 Tax=Haliotis rufescens TaxID=6454 RepID=UPI00201F01A8|nr:deleted in malignant brain tumors 1 protein-like [Haliotis rufescens]